MTDLAYGGEPIVYAGAPIGYGTSAEQSSGSGPSFAPIVYGGQAIQYGGQDLSYGASADASPIYTFVGATQFPPGSAGVSPVRQPLPGPLVYLVEVDAYRPASGTTGASQLPHTARPIGALGLEQAMLESADTIRASDLGYRTPPSGGSVTVYPPVLDTAFAIDRKLNLDPSQPAAAAGWGSVALINTSGRFDAVAAAENSDGRGVRISVGRKAYDQVRGYFDDPDLSTFRRLFTGLAQNWFCSDTSLSVPIRDASYFTERSVQQAAYGGTGGYDGDDTIAGTLKPVARGLVTNVTPILIDKTNRIYQWADGPVAGLDGLYEGGARTIDPSGDVADLYSGTTPSGHYRTCNARGLFQLGVAPVHQITVWGRGTPRVHTSQGSTGTVMDMALSLLLDDLNVPAEMVDTASFLSAAAAYPMGAGYYLTQAIEGATLLGQLVGSIGAKVFPRRDGRLAVMVLRALSASAMPAATYDVDNALSLTPTALGANLDPPPKRYQVGYQHNYTVQTTDLSPLVDTAGDRALIAQADRFAIASSGAVQIAYRRPTDPPQIISLLSQASHAQQIASELLALWATRRRLYNLTLPVDLGLPRDIGDVVRLVWPMDDLAGGRLGQIVGEQFRGGDATITFQVLV